MINIYVDRDSVAMGDDIDPHVVEWEFDDDATPGDVLVRVLSERYLASVAGNIAWAFEVGAFGAERYPDFVALRPKTTITAAAVLQPMGGPWQVVPLRASLITEPFRTHPDWAVADQEFAVTFRYSSAGAQLDSVQLSAWLS